jgi:hypothetical protein
MCWVFIVFDISFSIGSIIKKWKQVLMEVISWNNLPVSCIAPSRVVISCQESALYSVARWVTGNCETCGTLDVKPEGKYIQWNLYLSLPDNSFSRICLSISMVPERILFQLWLPHLLFSQIYCFFFRPPPITMNRGFTVHEKNCNYQQCFFLKNSWVHICGQDWGMFWIPYDSGNC